MLIVFIREEKISKNEIRNFYVKFDKELYQICFVLENCRFKKTHLLPCCTYVCNAGRTKAYMHCCAVCSGSFVLRQSDAFSYTWICPALPKQSVVGFMQQNITTGFVTWKKNQGPKKISMWIMFFVGLIAYNNPKRAVKIKKLFRLWKIWRRLKNRKIINFIKLHKPLIKKSRWSHRLY